MSRHETSIEAYQNAIDEGTDENLKRAFLKAFMEKPSTTWDAAARINPDNPHAVYKDGTSAVSWLRRTQLVVPAGWREVPQLVPDRKSQSQVLEAGKRAEDWLDDAYEPVLQPTEPQILKELAGNVERFIAARASDAEKADALLDDIEAGLEKWRNYQGVKSDVDVQREKAERCEELARTDLGSDYVVRAASDGVWIRRDGSGRIIAEMNDVHLHGAIRKCSEVGIKPDEQPFLALVQEAHKRGLAW